MNKDKFIKVRVTQEEVERLQHLVGNSTLSEFLLFRAFSTRHKEGNDQLYPGWQAVETVRRDRGIKIRHEKFPKAVILYPEDLEYKRFNKSYD